MNSCYLCHLHSYVFSLFSDSSASLYLIHLFWDNQMSENRRRFVSLVGHLQYFMGASCKVRSPWRTLPVQPDDETAS